MKTWALHTYPKCFDYPPPRPYPAENLYPSFLLSFSLPMMIVLNFPDCYNYNSHQINNHLNSKMYFSVLLSLKIFQAKTKDRRTLKVIADMKESNYTLLIKALERNGQGLIKAQKKNADGTYKETQLYWYRALDNQTDSTQELLLKSLVDGKMSWVEFQREGEIQRKLHRIQNAYMECLQVDSWAKVEERIPRRCSREELEKLLDVSHTL